MRVRVLLAALLFAAACTSGDLPPVGTSALKQPPTLSAPKGLTRDVAGFARSPHAAPDVEWQTAARVGLNTVRQNLTWGGVELAPHACIRCVGGMVTAPDGNLIDALVSERDATTRVHSITRDISVVAVGGGELVLSVYARGVARTKVGLRFTYDGGPDEVATFDLASGATLSRASDPGSDAGSVSVGGGWRRLHLSAVLPPGGAKSFSIELLDDAGNLDHAGVAGKGMRLWGLQLERAESGTPGPYTPARQVIDPVPSILAAAAEGFDGFAGATLDPDPASPVDGWTQTHRLHAASGSSTPSAALVLPSLEPGVYTFSVFVSSCAAGAPVVSLGFAESNGRQTQSVFDLTGGRPRVSWAANAGRSEVSYLGAGWYRLAHTFETVDDIPSRSVSIAILGGGACPGSAGVAALVAYPKVERSPRPTDLVTAGNVNLSAQLRGLGSNLIADSENPRSWGSSTVYTGGANAAAAPYLKAAGDASACNSCNLEDYGATVAAAKAAGLTVAVMAHVTPDWGQIPGHYEGWENGNVGFGPCPDTGGNRPPAWTDPPMFGTFIESQILTMPEVDAWSLWSEVDTAASWCVGIISRYGRPAAAALLLERVMQPGYAAVKAIRPDVPVVGLGLYDLRDGGKLLQESIDYWRTNAAGEVLLPFDIVGLDGYATSNDPMGSIARTEAAIDLFADPTRFVGEGRELQGMWLTEFSFSLDTAGSGSWSSFHSEAQIGDAAYSVMSYCAANERCLKALYWTLYPNCQGAREQDLSLLDCTGAETGRLRQLERKLGGQQ